jgi:DNA-binding LytR/AlgR family response regulator
MFAILKQPFPAHSLSGSIRMAALIGLFVAVFLFVFQPFGLRESPGGTTKLLAIAGYGLVSFGCISISAITLSKLFPGWFKNENWTVGKEMQITLFHFLLIGFFNTLYTFLIFRQPFSLSFLLYFELITLAVGIIPVSLIVLFRYTRLLQTNLVLAQEMNSELKPSSLETTSPVPNLHSSEIPETQPDKNFTFSSESGAEQIILSQQDFLFATAADNYVELHYIENGGAKKSLIRSSLSRVEEIVKTVPQLVRCHRAYLVNLAQVRNFSGNAQGLKLELNGTNELIPVSRKMVPEIKGLLHG